MNQRGLAIFLFLFAFVGGVVMVIIGAAVPMELNGILIGFGVFGLVVSLIALWFAARLSNSGPHNNSAATSDKTKQHSIEEKEAKDLEKGQANAVDQQLLEERMQSLYTFKILILGAGESGKSTVVKQLKLVHNSKIPQAQLVEDGNNLHQNIVDCFGAILQAGKRFGISLDSEDDEKTVAALSLTLVLEFPLNSQLGSSGCMPTQNSRKFGLAARSIGCWMHLATT